MKTREKIVFASLELFNEKGERNVSTNHIAAHLGISPGNLYYHYRNKTDIIYEIFLQYQSLVDGYMEAPSKQFLTVEDQFLFLEAVFEGLWEFRFLHRDLEHYLESDPRLQKDYQCFTQRCLDNISRIIGKLEDSSVLLPMSHQLRRSFALNTWIIITGWMSYLKMTAGCEGQRISKDRLRQGIYQVIHLEMPYLTPEALQRTLRLQESFKPILQ